MWWRSRRLTHTHIPAFSLSLEEQVCVSAPTVVCLHINNQCASKLDVAFQIVCKVRDLMAKHHVYLVAGDLDGKVRISRCRSTGLLFLGDPRMDPCAWLDCFGCIKRLGTTKNETS